MDGFISVAKVTDVLPGTMKTVTVSGKPIALVNVDGDFFAVDDLCTHKLCSLGTEGALDGKLVVCGCHGAKFDVTNGKVKALPAVTDVATYQVKVENGHVFVKEQ